MAIEDVSRCDFWRIHTELTSRLNGQSGSKILTLTTRSVYQIRGTFKVPKGERYKKPFILIQKICLQYIKLAFARTANVSCVCLKLSYSLRLSSFETVLERFSNFWISKFSEVQSLNMKLCCSASLCDAVKMLWRCFGPLRIAHLLSMEIGSVTNELC